MLTIYENPLNKHTVWKECVIHEFKLILVRKAYSIYCGPIPYVGIMIEYDHDNTVKVSCPSHFSFVISPSSHLLCVLVALHINRNNHKKHYAQDREKVAKSLASYANATKSLVCHDIHYTSTDREALNYLKSWQPWKGWGKGRANPLFVTVLYRSTLRQV